MDKDELTTVEKLKGVENWVVWKFQTKVFLNVEDLYNITIADNQPIGTSFTGDNSQQLFKTAFDAWKKRDSKAQRIIVRTMAHQAMMHIVNCETAYDM